jgi:hypothetical protein
MVVAIGGAALAANSNEGRDPGADGSGPSKECIGRDQKRRACEFEGAGMSVTPALRAEGRPSVPQWSREQQLDTLANTLPESTSSAGFTNPYACQRAIPSATNEWEPTPPGVSEWLRLRLCPPF